MINSGALYRAVLFSISNRLGFLNLVLWACALRLTYRSIRNTGYSNGGGEMEGVHLTILVKFGRRAIYFQVYFLSRLRSRRDLI